MSSRALRRAQKNKNSDSLESGESEMDSKSANQTRNPVNSFAAFSLLEDASDEEDGAAEESDVVDEEASIELTASSQEIFTVKKTKNVARAKRDSRITEENIDELLKDFQSKGILSESVLSDESLPCPLNEALSLDSNWLDANVELKKKFGGAISGGNSLLSEINSRAMRQNPALVRAIKRKPFKRKDGFISPRPLWPPFGPSDTLLSIRMVGEGDNSTEYEIVESEAYQAIFSELQAIVASGDLEFLMDLINTNPLFVDGLLLLSDAYRMQSTGDAGEIVERALYIFERVLPSDLSFLKGSVRFRYALPGNRKLHLALFRQIQFTMKKGCWKVALQLAKALLSLDPENDPLGARLFIDFLGLQSEKYDEFDRLWLELKPSICPLILPGWLFNRALGMFLEEENSKTEHSVSSDQLLSAINSSPITASLLSQTLKYRIPDSFSSLLSSVEPDFVQVGAAKIFVARSSSIWKSSPHVQKWFENASSKAVVSEDKALNLRKVSVSHQVSIYRHSLLSDLPSLNIAIPPEISKAASIFAYDPLPPEYFESDDKSIIQGLKDLVSYVFNRQS